MNNINTAPVNLSPVRNGLTATTAALGDNRVSEQAVQLSEAQASNSRLSNSKQGFTEIAKG